MCRTGAAFRIRRLRAAVIAGAEDFLDSGESRQTTLMRNGTAGPVKTEWPEALPPAITGRLF